MSEQIKGRGWGTFTPGDRMTSKDFHRIVVGQLILSETRKFGKQARNTIVVTQTEFPFDPENGNKLLYQYHEHPHTPTMNLWKEDLDSNIEYFYFPLPS